MRAELPWNVAGIPPEAREAARAAARREGLSVGEWLTRRILQSFSGLEDDGAPGSALDSWGLPASSVSRGDSEEMLARVGRGEADTNDAWRRIEEQLRGLGRRLDSSERTHSESNRVLSHTAQEINLSAREQAQAMEHLGHNIMALTERLERLERGGVSEGLKEAVKALHLGLTRLAEQITSTATNSTTQLAQVTINLEKLAGHVGKIWEDADNAAQLLERRIDVSEQDLGQRIANAERTIEARLSAVEKAAQFNANALDHALEKIDASVGQRGADQAESQRRALQQEEGVRRVQDTIARLETLLPGPEIDKRLGGVERSVQDLADRFERNDPAARFDAAMQAMSHRLEKVETDKPVPVSFEAPLQDLTQRLEKIESDKPSVPSFDAPLQALTERLEKLETAPPAFPAEEFEAPLQELSHRLEKLEKNHAELLAEIQARLPEPQPQPFDAPEPTAFETASFAEHQPVQEPASFEVPAQETFAHEPPAQETPAHEPPTHEAPEPPSVEAPLQETEADAFSSLPDFVFDAPHETHSDTAHEEAFTPDFDDVFEEPPFQQAASEEADSEEFAFEEAGDDEPDNFLAQARRSARAASEQAESEGRDRLSSFRPNHDDASTEEKEKPRFLIPVLVALLVVAAAAAALVLNQRAKLPAPAPVKPAAALHKAPAHPLPAAPKAAENQFVVAPPESSNIATVLSNAPSASGNAQDFNSQRSEPAASDSARPASAPSTPPAPMPSTPAAPPHAVVPSVSPTQPAPQKAASTATAPAATLPKTVAPVSVTHPGAALPVAKSAPAKPATPLERLTRLASAGNPTALTILGLRAADGTNGAPVNLPEAVKLLTQAAEKGQAVAQYRLGTLYERGQGVSVDGVKAVHWYGLAAAQGNRKAMHNLAVAYAGGIGGKKNMAEAARWFAKAAALGLSDSQFNLAVLYERGDGVPQSLADAYKWYAIAAATGDAESKARVGVLQTQLSDADKAAASRSVLAFHAAPLNRGANVPPEPTDLGN
jgi:localization factor PodJL